jgi:hypothetical protein
MAGLHGLQGEQWMDVRLAPGSDSSSFLTGCVGQSLSERNTGTVGRSEPFPCCFSRYKVTHHVLYIFAMSANMA